MSHNNHEFGTTATTVDMDNDTLALLTGAAGAKETKQVTAQTLTIGDGSELTIASGVITVTGNYHTVDTESDGASDDLDTINGGVAGQILTITAADAARSVVLKDGTGNINCGAAGTPGDITIDEAENAVTLVYTGTAGNMIAHGQNA